MDDVVEVLGRLARRAAGDPWMEQFRFEPRTNRELDAITESLAPLVLPAELDRLLRSGGHWPGYLLPAPDRDDGFTEALSGYDAHASDRHWVWFGTTWERDSCYVPVLADAHDTAPIGMFSGQMLTVSVPVPSITALLVCFEVAIDVLGRDDWDPTWCDLITAPPQPDAQRSDEGTQRQLTLHEALAPMRRSWASSHPCWDPTVMPFAWTEDPVAAAVDAMLGR
jgi:hypothetical protein